MKFADYIAIDFLPICHMCSQEDLWVRIVQNLGQDPATVLKDRQFDVIDRFVKNFDGSENMRACLKTLAFVGRDGIVGRVVDEFHR